MERFSSEKQNMYLILIGVVLFVCGFFIRQYHEFRHTSEGYLSGVSYPLYPVGTGLIIGAIVLFLVGFYLILKEKIQTDD